MSLPTMPLMERLILLHEEVRASVHQLPDGSTDRYGWAGSAMRQKRFVDTFGTVKVST